MGARAFIPAALVGVVLLSLSPAVTSPVAASEPKTEAQQIIAIARKQIGDPWRRGATGPRAFDCSGLVIYAFRKAGEAKVVGAGDYRSARALYRWFKGRGLADRKDPKPGDLVIWGRGTHVGIYIGDGKAISTLTRGVRIHKVHAVRAPFTAYLHTGMWDDAIDGGDAPQVTPMTSTTAAIAARLDATPEAVTDTTAVVTSAATGAAAGIQASEAAEVSAVTSLAGSAGGVR